MLRAYPRNDQPMKATQLIALSSGAFFLIASCAQTAQPVTVHMQANEYQEEHDEVVTPDATADYYPNRQSPHEVVFHKASGGMIDATCMDTECHQVQLKITGSKALPDGGYQFLQTDDPHILMVRDYEGTRTLGYFAKNNGGGGLKFFADLQEAQSYEHEGDTARTVGKVAVGVLLVAALVALAAGAAASEANANRVTTTCSSFGNSTTCTSR
jgi:hypothetical protein